MTKIKIEKNIEGLRIDKALPLLFKDYSRVYFSFLIKENKIKVNDKEISPSYKVKENDEISIEFKEEDDQLDIKPFKMQLDIIYEDDDVFVINKPKGLVVHPSNGHEDDTLVNALIYNHKELSKLNGIKRVGIVHRIDKDTSGLLLICKNDFAHHEIAKQLEDHSMHREYVALCDGNITYDNGKIVGSIGRDKQNRLKMAIDKEKGKSAITHYEVIKRFKDYTLIKCILETGRTHQIRIHMSSINHPIVGDNLYGGSTNIYNNGQLLHAYRLTFVQPHTKKEITVECPLPSFFNEVLDRIKN